MATLLKIGFHKYYVKYDNLQVETKKGIVMYDYYINPRYKIEEVNCRLINEMVWNTAISKWKSKYLVHYKPFGIYRLIDETELIFDNTNVNFKIIEQL